jgi:hypothetical protein
VIQEVQAHQLLHGYRSGHGQIAASTRLGDRDSELVTRLSDLSGSLSSGVKLDTYLTVYRLPSRKYFALARTWPDPEAPRAGCVLTHTILIPVAEWASFPSVRSIDRFFRNPRIAPEHDFSTQLVLSSRTDPQSLGTIGIDSTAAEMFVSRYFGRGLRPVVWFNTDESENCLWRLLEHLWPKLRSSFSCCTFSLQQRTLEDGPFDLLFAPPSMYSRFAKLSAEHLIEPGSERNAQKTDPEQWSRYWASALFSSEPGLPAKESELPIWQELGEDPTAIRKLSLVHELRLRAKESPTAGVGAIDVVESLAHDPDAAILLKHQVFADAIEAAAAAKPAEDALKSLRLIDDRLSRESFRDIAADFQKRLSLEVAELTTKEPEAVLQVSDTWLADSVAGGKGAFVQGVITGFRRLASGEPSRLAILRSFPDAAAELFRLEPTIGGLYLQVGGDVARQVLTAWFSSTQDMNTLRLVRKSVLSTLPALDDDALLPSLLRDLREEDVEETLGMLSRLSQEFSNRAVRTLVADRIGSVYPSAVRQWALAIPHWPRGIYEIVASTYPATRQGFSEVLDESRLDGPRRTELLAVMLRDQLSASCPYWLREFVSQDDRVLRVLLLSEPGVWDTIEPVLFRLLNEVPDLPLAKSADLLDGVVAFDGRPVFSKLLDSAIRSAIVCYVNEGGNQAQMFLGKPETHRWLSNVSASQLTALLVRGSVSGPDAVARAWKWIADAPASLYSRDPSALPELCDSLLVCVHKSFPRGVNDMFNKVLRRSRIEAGVEVRQILSGKLLRFALDNTRYPLGAVVAESFADVYAVAIRKDSRPPSFLLALFGLYDWDRGKDLRVSLIDAFQRSSWAPGDLAVAASNAGILPKIFKRLHRTMRGDDYIKSILQDLSQRNDPKLIKVTEHLKSLALNPDFYEEWD